MDTMFLPLIRVGIKGQPLVSGRLVWRGYLLRQHSTGSWAEMQRARVISSGTSEETHHKAVGTESHQGYMIEAIMVWGQDFVFVVSVYKL